jgi:hypothetical protein
VICMYKKMLTEINMEYECSHESGSRWEHESDYLEIKDTGGGRFRSSGAVINLVLRARLILAGADMQLATPLRRAAAFYCSNASALLLNTSQLKSSVSRLPLLRRLLSLSLQLLCRSACTPRRGKRRRETCQECLCIASRIANYLQKREQQSVG